MGGEFESAPEPLSGMGKKRQRWKVAVKGTTGSHSQVAGSGAPFLFAQGVSSK